MDINKVILVGRLVRDPQCAYSQGGMAYTRFTVACERMKKKGEAKAESDFIGCVAFGKTAELIGNNLHKGSKVLVEGSVRTGNYVDKTGKKVYTTDISATNVHFLEGKGGNAGVDYGTPVQNSFEGMGTAVSEGVEVAF